MDSKLEKNVTVVPHRQSYMTFRILYDEHIKTNGQLVEYTKDILKSELGVLLEEEVNIDKTLNHLIIEGLIQENPSKQNGKCYTTTLKGNGLYSKHKDSELYQKYHERSKVQAHGLTDPQFIRGLSIEVLQDLSLHFFVSLDAEEK